MNLARRFSVGIINYGLGGILPKVVGFFLIPLYTVYLTPEDFGILELAAGLSGFVTPLMGFGIPGATVRYFYEYDGVELDDFISTMHRLLLGLGILSGVLALVIVYSFGDFLAPGLLFSPYILMVVLASFFTSNIALQKKIIQCREQSAYSARLSIVYSFVGIGLTLLLVIVFEMGALGVLTSQLVVAGLFFLQAQYYLFPNIRGLFVYKNVLEATKYGLGVLPHHLITAAGPLISNLALAGTQSVSMLGIYALGLRFIQPLTILASAFQTAFSPIYYSIRKKIDKEEDNTMTIEIMIGLLMHLSVVVFLIYILLMPLIFGLLIPRSYNQSINLIHILALGFLGRMFYMLFFVEFFYLKKSYLAPIVTAFGLITNIVLVLFLVKDGAKGVSWAFSISSLVWFLTTMIIVGIQKTRFKIPVYDLVLCTLASVGGFILVELNLLFFVKVILIGAACLAIVVYNFTRIKFFLSYTKK